MMIAINRDYAMHYLTCPIVRSNEELLAAAKQDEVFTRFGTSKQPNLKIFNALDAAVLIVVIPTGHD